MKFGMRKPSINKSLKARTTGKLKRSLKRAVIPGYGKKGRGWIRNPKRALYNKIYKRSIKGPVFLYLIYLKDKVDGSKSNN